MAKVKGINVVFIYVLDMAKVRSFYEAAFDLGKPLVDAKWWVEYALGTGSHLALHLVDPQHVQRAGLGHGAVRFSVEVDDIQAFAAAMRAATDARF